MSYIVYELKDASRLKLIGSNSFVLLCTLNLSFSGISCSCEFVIIFMAYGFVLGSRSAFISIALPFTYV